MATVARVERRGDRLALWMNDGSITFANPYPNGQWVVPVPSPGGGGGGGGGGGTSNGVMVTAGMITAAATSAGSPGTNMVDTAQHIADSFNNAVSLVDASLLSSKARAACLVGECAFESAWFQTTEEYGQGAGHPYPPYYGRGYLQITWQSNYAAFGQWCASKGLISDPNQFVNSPGDLAALKWAALSAVWYFSKTFQGYTLFEWCDKSGDPWYEVSNAINSGSVYGTSREPLTRAGAIRAALAVAPDPSAGGGSSPSGDKLVAWIKAHEGRYEYSQGPARYTPDTSGYCDCSSLMRYCYKQVLGIEIGTYTGDQQNYGSLVQNGTGQLTDTSILRPGDLIFFNWYYPTATFDHVEMYLGSGSFGADTICGHGGPMKGPIEKSCKGQTGAAAGGWRVRRYV